MRVRFTINDLGASELDDLGHVVSDVYGVGDEGVVTFKHPNEKLAREGWRYVRVRSKTGRERDLYVGILPRMCEAVPGSKIEDL